MDSRTIMQTTGGLTGFEDEEDSEMLMQMSSKMNPTAIQQPSHNLLSPATAAMLEGLEEEESDDEEGGDGGYRGNEKRSGRRKIKIEYIGDKSRRHITFSKRKAGIMKKAYELSTLTGTQVLLLVASETGHVYTFATPKLQPLITKPEGKNLIQACLNAPDASEYDTSNIISQNSVSPASSVHAAAHYYQPPPTSQSYQGREEEGAGIYQPPSVYTLYPGRPQTGNASNAPPYYYPPPPLQSHSNPGAPSSSSSSYHSHVGHHAGVPTHPSSQPTGFWTPNTGLNSSPIKAPTPSSQPYHHMNNSGHHVHSHLSHNHLHHGITNGLQQDD